MEVVMAVPPPPPPRPPMDFNFDSNSSSPYTTAPSSPQRFTNFFFSAPASPTHSLFLHSAAATTTTTTTTTNNNRADFDENFEFDFSGHLQKPSISADELFHGGKILPSKLSTSTETANKSRSKKEQNRIADQEERRVERASSFSLPSSPPRSSSIHRGSGRRSLSSVSEFNDVFPQFDTNNNNNNNNSNNSVTNTTTTTSTTAETASTFSSFLQSISFAKGYRKWRLKDFLLFRSASEGRATDKDPLRKYAAALSRTSTMAHEDVMGSSSFRSTAESSGSMSRRRGPVSAHELHYTLNRAASEELRKKTMLPYKQGLLGCLGFNQGMRQISGRFGSMERS